MQVVVVTSPTQNVVTLAQAKAHLRVAEYDADGVMLDGGDDDLIAAYLAAAAQVIDGPAGWLGRSLAPQTLELRGDRFCDPIRLPYGPVQSVTSVKYVDASGVEQTVPAEQYALAGDYLSAAYGGAWPTPRGDREGVRIRYLAGYTETPAPIVAAILLMVGDLYANRETVGERTGKIDMSTTVQALLAPYRVWSI